MIGSLPPLTDEQLIKYLWRQIEISDKLYAEHVAELRQTIKEQKELITEMHEYIRDNI